MGAERLAGGHTILYVPGLTGTDGTSEIVGSIERTATVDIIVGAGGEVLKDRHGDAAAVLTRLRFGLAARDLASEPEAPTLLGVPLDQVAAVTLDGAHWLEVFGYSLQLTAPLGGPVLTFRIAQAPGGKARKLGIGQDDWVTTPLSAVRGVHRKLKETF